MTILMLILPISAIAGFFGEGYSSMAPGGPSDISFRAFTIYTQQEACEKSAHPTELRIIPNPLILKIGDRIHRSNVNVHQSELVIEAYGKSGDFLPAVPIIVSMNDVQNVTVSRSDWDYFEAIHAGQGELVAAWACDTRDGRQLEARVRLIVTSGNQ